MTAAFDIGPYLADCRPRDAAIRTALAPMARSHLTRILEG
jgi:hypothetical protein